MKREIFEKLVNLITKEFRISRDELFSKSRESDKVDARYLLYYLCKSRPMSVSMIKKFMEENGHKTTHSLIIYGVDRMTSKVREDVDYARIADKVIGDGIV